MMLKVFVVGWIILIVAIVLNALVGRIGITTWYPFFDEAGKIGLLKAFIKTSLISKLFLVVIYPALLGLTGYYALKFFKLF